MPNAKKCQSKLVFCRFLRRKSVRMHSRPCRSCSRVEPATSASLRATCRDLRLRATTWAKKKKKIKRKGQKKQNGARIEATANALSITACFRLASCSLVLHYDKFGHYICSNAFLSFFFVFFFFFSRPRCAPRAPSSAGEIFLIPFAYRCNSSRCACASKGITKLGKKPTCSGTFVHPAVCGSWRRAEARGERQIWCAFK